MRRKETKRRERENSEKEGGRETERGKKGE